MAKHSIRVKSATLYEIEVNCKGDTISFDPNDITLTSRLMKAFDKIDRLTADYEAKALEIDARPDEPLNEFVTRNQYDGVNLINDMYTEARAALDGFLGVGACQKIFGDANYLTMFDDLKEQLEPHFKAIGISAAKLREGAVAKYAPKSKTVLK